LAAAHPFDLSSRRALVSGGGSGLGLAIARGLAEAGATVLINGRDRGKLHAAARVLAQEDLKVDVSAFDVTDVAAVYENVSRIERETGAIDILVNNAAVSGRKPFVELDVDNWRSVQSTNVEGPFVLMHAVVPGMRSRRRGKIINICSLSSDLGRPNTVAYAASKGALKMLTRALAVELAPSNIQVNGIAPGFFKTPMNEAIVSDPDFSAWVEKRTPAGRWGEPPDIAGAAVFLASAAADYVTGHLLYVDGGFSAAY
jgi:gluconate 5-dehydrogenase